MGDRLGTPGAAGILTDLQSVHALALMVLKPRYLPQRLHQELVVKESTIMG